MKWCIISAGVLVALAGIIAAQRVCNLQADIAFVIDSSGSIIADDPRNWDRVLDFVVKIVRQLDIGLYKLRVGAVTFSNKGYLQFYLNNYTSKAELVRAIYKIGYEDGNTNTSGGLYVMNKEIFVPENGDRPNVRNIGIVITDGVATRDKDKTIPYADEAKNSGTKLIAVGIGDEIDINELTQIASPPDPQTMQTVYTVKDFRALTQIIETLVVETCILLTTTPPTTTTPPPTTTTDLPRAPDCRSPVDLVFILDASGSVDQDNFQRMKYFVGSLVSAIDVDGGVARVGLLTFADKADVMFHLNKYKRRLDIVRAIDKVPYSRGTTNTADALKTVYEEMFKPQNGARDRVTKIALLVTDGNSNERQKTLMEAREVKKRGITLFVIAVGKWYDEIEMNAIASYPYYETRYVLNDFMELTRDEFIYKLRVLFCNGVNECSSNPCRYARRCEDHPGFFSCTCYEGYGGSTCSERCREPADVIFAIDSSSSIGSKNFQKVLDYAREIVAGMRIGDKQSRYQSRVGLLTFSDEPHVIFNLKDYHNKYDILNAFTPHYTGGGTGTAEALKVVRETMFTQAMGDQRSVRNILIVITDGKSRNETATWQEARLTREAGIVILVVGIGRLVKEKELDDMATNGLNTGKSNYWIAESFDRLRSIKYQLSSAVCNNDNECASYPCRNGGRCHDMIQGYQCQCSDRYTGVHCERRCSGKADIIFALDTSGSIRPERFNLVRKFVKNIIKNLEIDVSSKTRIGFLTWSNEAKVEFKLGFLTSAQDSLQAVDYVTYDGGRTNTASALETMRTEMFTTDNGDRRDTQNYVIMITDGNSNVNRQDTIKAAIRVRLQGAHITTVSIGKQVNRAELEAIVSPEVDDNLFSVDKFDELMSLSNNIVENLCNDVDECRSNPCRNGGRCVDGNKRFTCICQSGWAGVTCTQRCRRQIDVVFVLDMSGSTEVSHKWARLTAKQIVTNLDMNFGRVHVGLITYGDNATIHFYLDTYSEKQEILNAICFVPEGGRTNTVSGLRTAQMQLFNSSRGDRPGIDDVIVLVTDGYSNVDRQLTIPTAQQIKERKIAIYVIAVGDKVDMQEVNAVAGKRDAGSADEYIFRLKKESDVKDVSKNLANKLCQ